MPWVDLSSQIDYASIYYTTNTYTANVSGFDPDKATIVVLHPIFLDSTWLELQLGDERLYRNYNLIAFDMRCAGQSHCRPSASHDNWVNAADLAQCFMKLHLPASHILALEGTSVYTALSFAILFPEYVNTLTLANVPAPIEQPWIYANMQELVHAACFATDLETCERTAFECVEFIFGPATDPELRDDVIVYWEKQHAPAHRVRVAETMSVYLNRTGLTPEMLSRITKPVLIVQGEKNAICAMKNAHRLRDQLINVPGGPVLYDVKAGRSMLSLIPYPASALNNVFDKFLKRFPNHRSDLVKPAMRMQDRMSAALKRLAEFTGNAEMETRNPTCSLSFSCMAPDVVSAQAIVLQDYARDARWAFNVAKIPGRTRRYSDRAATTDWTLTSEISEGDSSLVFVGPVNSPSERGRHEDDDEDRSESSYNTQRMDTRSEAHMSVTSTTTKRTSISSGHDSMSPLVKTVTAYAAPATSDKKGDKKGIKAPPGKIAVTTTTNFTQLTGAF
ncbi:hypothetical protein D9619_001071 [Psilocybe cf. subviscida]|uniref:AB hydrolase-1 domain-containing protein n=1 Tax=Psilocybe cf. subviscida TaxID=2480587 RepID=A0A8H5BF24_9AGAR|nr:hypothetical protein D9619_001071 [Psilocybe cf. subviscida]